MENFSWKQWLVRKHRSDYELGHTYPLAEAGCHPNHIIRCLPLSVGYRLNRRREAGKTLRIVSFFPLSDQPQAFGFWSDGWACFHFVGLIVFDYVIIPLS